MPKKKGASAAKAKPAKRAAAKKQKVTRGGTSHDAPALDVASAQVARDPARDPR